MKSLNKNFLPVHEADDVYTKEEVYTKDEVDALIEGGGGGGASGLKVTVTADNTGDTTVYTLDKNYTEIMAVVNNGITPVFSMLRSSIGTYQYFLFGGSAEVEHEGQTIYSVILYDPDRSTAYGLVTIQFMSDSATGTLIGEEV